jgi:catechol 2,3-dioxygenase-like lactoylglutathione lyase family enzyme
MSDVQSPLRALWSKGLFAITIYADDLVASRHFYGEVLQMEEIFFTHDSVGFKMGSACINVLMKENAPELVEPLPIAPSSAGSRSLLTVTVDNVDVAHAALVARGVRFLNGPMDRPWGMRTAAFADPSGHCWELAQRIDSGAS